jgi:phosphomannomutase
MFEPHEFNKNILRAYDIRGIVKETLNSIDAERLGNIFASSFGNESKKLLFVEMAGYLLQI